MEPIVAVPGQEMDEGLEELWTQSTQGIASIDPATENWKIQTLPLARIKKIMKSEEFILQELEREKQQKAADEGQSGEIDKQNVKFMISGEAPVLMSKACELLIQDLSFRAWRHTERNRRRTLQRQDLHAAVGESEVYDFLIDIVPRVTTQKASVANPAEAAVMAPTIPSGLPMGNMVPNMPQAIADTPGINQPMPAMMDNSMMQQMQPQAQQAQQQGQQQYQQQHPPQYQSYMSVPQAAPADSNPTNTSIGEPSELQPPQPAPQWMTQPVSNNGNTPQPS